MRTLFVFVASNLRISESALNSEGLKLQTRTDPRLGRGYLSDVLEPKILFAYLELLSRRIAQFREDFFATGCGLRGRANGPSRAALTCGSTRRLGRTVAARE